MKEMVRYGLILSVICIVASGLLAAVNSLTKARIVAQAQENEEDSLREIIPAGENFLPVKKGEEIIYYKVNDKEGKFIGVAFKAYGDGYSSDIVTLVGMTPEGAITAIKVLEQNETPGLGTRVAEPAFSSQFSNKGIKNLNQIQAISGATISSTAVIDSVREKAREIEALLKNAG